MAVDKNNQTERTKRPITIIVSHISRLIRRDFWMILIIMIALLISMLALLRIGTAIQACNDHWQTEIETRCTCTWTIQQTPPPTFNYTGWPIT